MEMISTLMRYDTIRFNCALSAVLWQKSTTSSVFGEACTTNSEALKMFSSGKFHKNGKFPYKIHDAEVQYIQTIDHLIASRISMKLQLQGVHFSSVNSHLMPGGGIYNSYTGQMMNSLHGNSIGGGGSLILRCTATIGDFYQEYKEIELGAPQKDPVPARVTLSSGSGVTNFFSSYFSNGSEMMSTTPSFLFLMIILTSVCTMSTIVTPVVTGFEAIAAVLTNVPRIPVQRSHSAVAHARHSQQLLQR